MPKIKVEVWEEQREFVDPELVPNEVYLAEIFEILYTDLEKEKAYKNGLLDKVEFEVNMAYSWRHYYDYYFELIRRGFNTVPEYDGFNEAQWNYIRELFKMPKVTNGLNQLEVDRKFWKLWLLREDKRQMLESMNKDSGVMVGKPLIDKVQLEFEELKANLIELGWEYLPSWD